MALPLSMFLQARLWVRAGSQKAAGQGWAPAARLVWQAGWAGHVPRAWTWAIGLQEQEGDFLQRQRQIKSWEKVSCSYLHHLCRLRLLWSFVGLDLFSLCQYSHSLQAMRFCSRSGPSHWSVRSRSCWGSPQPELGNGCPWSGWERVYSHLCEPAASAPSPAGLPSDPPPPAQPKGLRCKEKEEVELSKKQNKKKAGSKCKKVDKKHTSQFH